jgi:D-arabinose 1-dehydrogenase-like Zn-dependent alcohol dehydrogenase
MSSSSSQPLAGRRIWIAGIGGAGMSAYALLAHAWGAEVAGWDRTETPYLAHLGGVDVKISPEPPEPPSGWCLCGAPSSSPVRTGRRRRAG